MKKIFAAADSCRAKICIFSDQCEDDQAVLIHAITAILSPDVYVASYDEAVEENLHCFDLVVFLLNATVFDANADRLKLLIGRCAEERVSVLPVLTEKHLDAVYLAQFGTKQYLLLYDDDPTAIPFHDKLFALLNESFVEKDVYEQVKDSFKARIFLSYRKKDRAVARKLMAAIHERQLFRDVAIWFDEYITPGEQWNAEIYQAISAGDSFVLAVTPNLFEKDNYVVQCEYPACLSLGKPCLALQMEEVPIKSLRELFKGLKSIYSVRDSFDAFFEELKHCLGLKEHTLSAAEKYLLGLAYLFGIVSEKNADYALCYIEDSAKAFYLDAMERLAIINKYGIGKEVDPDAAILWKSKILAYRKETGDPESCLFAYLGLIEYYAAFEEYGEILQIYRAEISETYRDDQLPAISCRRAVLKIRSHAANADYRVNGKVDAAKMTAFRDAVAALAEESGETEDLKSLLSASILFYKCVSEIGEYRKAFSAFSSYADESAYRAFHGSDYAAVILAFNYLFCKAEAYILIDEAQKAQCIADDLRGRFDLLLPQDQRRYFAWYHEIYAWFYDATSMGQRVFPIRDASEHYRLWIEEAGIFAGQTNSIDAQMDYAKALLSSCLFALFQKQPLAKKDFAEAERIFTKIRTYSDRFDVRIHHGRLLLARGILAFQNNSREEALSEFKAAAALTEQCAMEHRSRRAQRVYFISLAYIIETLKADGAEDLPDYLEQLYSGTMKIFAETHFQSDFNNLLFAVDLYIDYWEKTGSEINMWKYKAKKDQLLRRFQSPLQGMFTSVTFIRYTHFDGTYLSEFKSADF